MLRHACGYALANKGHDTRAIQGWSPVNHQHRRLHSHRRSRRIRAPRRRRVAWDTGGARAGAGALAATYRAAAFFRLSSTARSCSTAPVGAPRRHSCRRWRGRRRLSGVSRAVWRAGRSVPPSCWHGERTRAWPESLEVRHKALADYGTERLRGPRFSLPSVRDCFDCANRCLDMWNDSVDHAARSELLQMADRWLQLASELDQQDRQTNRTDVERRRRRV
jgi:hypothetical protein